MSKEEKSKTPPAVDYEPYMLKRLEDPAYAVGVLNESLESYILDGHIESFNLAIKTVLKAQNISKLSRETGISTQHIHRIITGKSKPTFDLLVKLFKYLGYQFELKPIEKSA